MGFVRSIGRWTMTALFVNCIIGSGIFGLPGELTRLLGRASPFAMIFAALGMAIIMACIAEVASQFNGPGGPYLYVRTAFGRFLAMQIGWFHLLAAMSGLAALANLFVSYLATFLPWETTTWQRSSLMAILIAIPAVTNYLGVRSGANLSNVMTLAKLLPLALLILFGMARFAHQPQMIRASETISPSLPNWISALVLLLFVYGGWEDGLIPTGEIKEPRRTIPFGLGAGLLVCTAIYALLQFVTVATIGTSITDRPLEETASVLLGHGGAALITIAVMVATYGTISANILNAPRLTYSLAAQGDFPAIFARLHPRFHTPAAGILSYAVTAWALASSGTFLWIVALSSGSIMVYYAGNVRFADTSAEAAPERRRFQNSIRAHPQYCWGRNLSGADDRIEAPRASPDVCHRTDRHRQLAVGQTAPLGTGNEGRSGDSYAISSLTGPRLSMGRQHDWSAVDR